MIPVIALVGRPNVGKSTLFNVLTRSRDALVLDAPGVTRDRQYGQGEFAEQKYIVIDTGGLIQGADRHKNLVAAKMLEQSWQAAEESDCIFFIVDGRSGLTPEDEKFAKELRALSKPIYVVVNKTEGLSHEASVSEFYSLGLGEPIPISASHGQGVHSLLELALEQLQDSLQAQAQAQAQTQTEAELFSSASSKSSSKENLLLSESGEASESGIKLAIVGRPNVGKSTLVNRILGFERVIVLDEPGTTRDSIYVPLEREGQKYTLIDTAGVRRRARVTEAIEKFSVIKTLQAIENANVVIMVMDAKEGITDQDLGLLGFVLETGRALVIALNKWDGLSPEHREEIKQKVRYRLNFADFARVHWISALHGSGVGNLFDSVTEAYDSATRVIGTSEVNRILEDAVLSHPPPMISGRRIKLRYAHVGGHQPPLIVIHGNQTEQVPLSYKRYLANSFRKALNLRGTPVRIEFKTSKNPYAARSKQAHSKPSKHSRVQSSSRQKRSGASQARSRSAAHAKSVGRSKPADRSKSSRSNSSSQGSSHPKSSRGAKAQPKDSSASTRRKRSAARPSSRQKSSSKRPSSSARKR